jgi:hypothetical protein
MERFVWSGGCRSWSKSGRVDRRVTAVWQGSAIGVKEVSGELRPEDLTILWRTGNRYGWMGDRRTRVERTKEADLARYLKKQSRRGSKAWLVWFNNREGASKRTNYIR